MPAHIFRLNSRGYTWHLFARPDSRGTCVWCFDLSAPEFGHFTAIRLMTSFELLMILVLFRAGPWTAPVSTRIP